MVLKLLDYDLARLDSQIGALLKCCPIDNTFKLIGKKFTIHILRNMLLRDQSRFNQFMGSIEDINPKTLSARLREMEKAGLIKRKVFNETPIRVEYSLTDKGKSLRSILEQMAAFSLKFCCNHVVKDGKPKTLHQVFGMTPTILK